MTVATQKYGLYEDECKKLKKYFLQLSNLFFYMTAYIIEIRASALIYCRIGIL